MSPGERDYGRELYPFLYDDGGAGATPAAVEEVLAEVRRSTLEKARVVTELRASLLDRHRAEMARAAARIAEAFTRGATLLAFGNGGSATDAADAVADCLHPPVASWRRLPALDLSSDPSIVTAISNDVGVDNVFARQVIAYARAGDVALGFSTSGNSPNVVAGLVEARRQGLLTIGFAGYDGGRVAASGAVDHCFVAPSDHIPRIQEAHATAWHALLDAVQATLADAPAPEEAS